MLLIPSIDLRGGRCVRLLRGDFAAETRYEVDPLELLQRYQSLGASWLHVVDLDGARDGALGNLPVLQTLAAQAHIRLQVGGGIRSREAAYRLLNAGVQRIVIGSAAIETPQDVMQWIREFGAERCCLALDVRLDEDGIPRVQIRGWTAATTISLWEALAVFLDAGIKDILCTDIAQDGALEGPNLTLYREAAQRFPSVAWQASGGVSQISDLHALAEVGVAAAISGKALLDSRINDVELATWFATPRSVSSRDAR